MSKSTTPANASNTANNLPSDYQTAMAELENIVARMETGQLKLEDSLADYKRGAALLQFCQQQLQAAEQQVKILNENNKLSLFEG